MACHCVLVVVPEQAQRVGRVTKEAAVQCHRAFTDKRDCLGTDASGSTTRSAVFVGLDVLVLMIIRS